MCRCRVRSSPNRKKRLYFASFIKTGGSAKYGLCFLCFFRFFPRCRQRLPRSAFRLRMREKVTLCFFIVLFLRQKKSGAVERIALDRMCFFVKIKTKRGQCVTAKKMFLCINSAVVYLYGIMNATATLLYFFASLSESALYENIITADVYTWHIFGIFAIGTPIVKLWQKNKEDKETPFAKFLKTDIVLHAAFTVISAACIIFLFNRAF